MKRNYFESQGNRVLPVITLGFVLFLLVGFFGTVSASEPTIVISSYRIQPEVVMPGENALITVTVTNTAQKASLTTTEAGTGQSATKIQDINAYLSDVDLYGDGLEVESGDYERIGEIGPGQSVPITFLVKAPYQTGIYFPELHISTDGGRSLKYPIPFNVNDDRLVQKNPAIQIEKEIPSDINPGTDATGRLVLQNTGETSASEISVCLNSTSQEVSILSPGMTHISKLGPGDNYRIDLDIVSTKEAEEGIHPIICTVQYSTASGTLKEQREVIPVKLTGRSDLAIAAVTTDPVRLQEGSPFTLIVRIENTGTGDADGVRAEIQTPINGTKEAFVGKIEPDNDAPAVFYLQNAQAGDLVIPVTISHNPQ